MTATLTPISGLGAKVPACFLVEAEGARLLLDIGYGPDPGVYPDVSGVGNIDAVLLSHSHPDHAGALSLTPALGNPRVYASDICRRLVRTEIRTDSLPLHGETTVCGVRVTTGRSGHAPGGIWMHLAVGDGLLYMGDSCTESLIYAHDEPPQAGTAIVDASYGAYDSSLDDCAPPYDQAIETGPVLMPVPPAGRGPEMALHVFQGGRAVPHVDDALRAAARRLATDDRACLRSGIAERLAKLADDAPPIVEPKGAMFTCGADANYGDAQRFVAQWEHDKQPAIIFSGYLTPGTPAQRLTDSGRAQYRRWNVHPRLSDNARLVRRTGARQVLPAFGGAKHVGAWETAFAPAKIVMQGRVTL